MLSSSKGVGLRAGEAFVEQLGGDLGRIEHGERRRLPDFLIVGPGRTGTTWLAKNLERHEGIFIPPEKELNYFSSNWQRCEIGWYLSFFAGHEQVLKGDASPAYATLSSARIKVLAEHLPHLRIIFLLREPLARAASVARHCVETGVIQSLHGSSSDLLELLLSEGAAAADDYLGCLQRWVHEFGREKVFIGFTEEITGDAERLLARVCSFLGAGVPADWSGFPVAQRINVTATDELPADVRQVLARLYAPRIPRLQEFLDANFGLRLPDSWLLALDEPDADRPMLLRNSSGACDTYVHDGQFIVVPKSINAMLLTSEEIERRVQTGDFFRRSTLTQAEYVGGVLFDLASQCLDGAHNQTEPSLWLVDQNFFGFNIVVWQGRSFALDVRLGDVDLRLMSPAALAEYVADGRIIEADTVAEVRALVRKPRAAPAEPVAVAAETEQYVLVRTPDGAVAVSKALGHVALFVERLGERELAPNILHAASLDELRGRVNALEASSRCVQVQLVGELGLYNLVRAGDRMLAVSKLLGEVLLLEERLGEREISPWILAADTEAELRVRVRSLEVALAAAGVHADSPGRNPSSGGVA